MKKKCQKNQAAVEYVLDCMNFAEEFAKTNKVRRVDVEVSGWGN